MTSRRSPRSALAFIFSICRRSCSVLGSYSYSFMAILLYPITWLFKLLVGVVWPSIGRACAAQSDSATRR